MSGIYGIYRYDGAPLPRETLERMRAAMAFYGPDGGGSRVEDAVGLGHLLLAVNPEDSFESQPVRAAYGLMVSAVRLDNRAALIEELQLSEPEAARLSDGELASLAYERWGKELCSHLQGDWALAAWDRRHRRLLLARDACGNATLYFYEGKGFIAFASSLNALLALPGVEHEPDRLRLAEVLVSWQHDAERTAYKGFRRLVWAHAMTVGADGRSRAWRHWSPLGRERFTWRQDEEYVEAFLEHYTRAVQSSLRTEKPVAAELSGGRDSGSVVAMAAPLLARAGRGLTAYTSVPCLPPDGAAVTQMGDEGELAQQTAAMAGENLTHQLINAAGDGVLSGIDDLLDAHEGPAHAVCNHYWLQAIMHAAQRGGAGVLLSGQMGNATVSWQGSGSSLLALLQGSPATAWRLFLRAEPNPWLSVKRQLLKPLLKPAWINYRRFTTAPSRIWREYSALNLQAAAELDIDGRMRTAGFDPAYNFSPLEDIRPLFFEAEWGIGRGIGAEMAARHSLASIDPTANLSLIEFLLRVPDDRFYRGGKGSFLIRRAFRDRLPEAVLKAQRKGLQAADVGHRILRELPAFEQTLNSLDALPETRAILDMPLMHRCLRELAAKVDPETTARATMILLRGLGVGIFLRRLSGSRS
jgi:asparagine synthase (glutamine-hydrolysing)